MIGPYIEQVGAESDLSEILAEVSGSPELVGALSALNPRLAQKVAKASVNQQRRVMTGSTSEGRPLNTHLPMTNGSNAVAAAASVALTGTVLRDFKPHGLIVQTDGVAVTIGSITIANIPQLAGNTGALASDVFKRDAVLPFELNWDVIPTNQSIIVPCTNNHAATACAIYGGVFGKYTQS